MDKRHCDRSACSRNSDLASMKDSCWLTVVVRADQWHFCSWWCLAQWAVDHLGGRDFDCGLPDLTHAKAAFEDYRERRAADEALATRLTRSNLEPTS